MATVTTTEIAEATRGFKNSIVHYFEVERAGGDIDAAFEMGEQWVAALFESESGEHYTEEELDAMDYKSLAEIAIESRRVTLS